MGGPPLSGPFHIFRALVMLSVLRPGKPTPPALAGTCLLALRLAAVLLVAQMSGVRAVQLATVPAFTLAPASLLRCLHPAMMRHYMTTHEEDRHPNKTGPKKRRRCFERSSPKNTKNKKDHNFKPEDLPRNQNGGGNCPYSRRMTRQGHRPGLRENPSARHPAVS